MKKYCRVILCLILCCNLMGCSNGKNISRNSLVVQDLPSITMDGNNKEVVTIEQNNLKNIKATKDNKLKLNDGIQDLLHVSDRKYTIEDKKYKQNQHKGEFNVTYPVLKSEKKNMNVVNSVILARVVNELYYEDAETTIDIDLDYEVKHANDAFISILFTVIIY